MPRITNIPGRCHTRSRHRGAPWGRFAACEPPAGRAGTPWPAGLPGFLLFLVPLLVVAGAWAADLKQGRSDFLAGRYAECIAAAEKGVEDTGDEHEWHLLLVRSLFELGRYPDAYNALTNALAHEQRSIRLRWVGRDVLQMQNQPERAAAFVDEITELVTARPWAYREAPDLVVFGQAAMAKGLDPKRVLDRVFEPAKKLDPKLRDTYLAIGGLALEKGDYALAARTFQDGLKLLPDDPDLHFGLARAYEPSEKTLMISSLEAALERHTNHVSSLLLLIDRAVDAENYDEARNLISRVHGVNPYHPEAWAYAAVAAHLEHQPAREQAAVEMALKFWPTNPRVPHLMGRKLSQNYRFTEGAALQRRALRFDRQFLPAKSQLAQDLLRLGEDEEGWRLADEVHEADGYDIAALNLVTLRDAMDKFAVLTNEHFVVRMTRQEAGLYGARVLELLEQARARLSPKYGLELTRPVRIEIFADQKDFAVRTFGMPQNHGFLGVCFGQVITANSPASRPGQAFNWESMLWHEFTHVITLQLTHNKMPRWVSEGISVYEERQANPAWGERLIPRYREMIVEGELTPVSELSGAFMSPPTPTHLQFAYYQSSLVIEFLVDRFGAGALQAILRDLGDGKAINDALEAHTVPMDEFEEGFETFARRLADELAPGLDWEKPELEALLTGGADDTAWKLWARGHPKNFYVLTRQANDLIEEKRWADARPVLEQLVDLYPRFTGSDSAYRSLAKVCRELGDEAAEREAWRRLAEQDGEALDAFGRLMELARAATDWPAVVANARRYLAVNPLVAAPYRYLAEAAEGIGDRSATIIACRALLQLDPANPAEVHYRLARQLHALGDPTARRHLLQALEEAPRYRDALRLLLEMEPSPPPPAAQTHTAALPASSAGGAAE